MYSSKFAKHNASTVLMLKYITSGCTESSMLACVPEGGICTKFSRKRTLAQSLLAAIVFSRSASVVHEKQATPVADPGPSVGQKGCRCCLRAHSPAPQRSGLPTRPAGPPHLCGCWESASGTQQTSCTASTKLLGPVHDSVVFFTTTTAFLLQPGSP